MYAWNSADIGLFTWIGGARWSLWLQLLYGSSETCEKKWIKTAREERETSFILIFNEKFSISGYRGASGRVRRCDELYWEAQWRASRWSDGVHVRSRLQSSAEIRQYILTVLIRSCLLFIDFNTWTPEIRSKPLMIRLHFSLSIWTVFLMSSVSIFCSSTSSHYK